MAFKLDFNKLRDPAEHERIRLEREANELKAEQLKKELRTIVDVCLDAHDQLNEKERSLVRSCDQRMYSLGFMSDAQEKWLRDIHSRVTAQVFFTPTQGL